MFYNVALSTANYDALLVGWNAQNLKTNVIFNGGNSKYSSTAAQTARANMINMYHWTITDAGYIPPTPTPTTTQTPTITPTPNATLTLTSTITSTPTPTITMSATVTSSSTISSIVTSTVTVTPTSTISATPTRSVPDLHGNSVIAFPNPGHGIIHFTWSEPNAAKIKICVFNLSGERIAALIAATPGQSLDWNASGVAPGIYIYRVTLTVNGVEHQLPVGKIAVLKP
jgi:hypothetical protein